MTASDHLIVAPIVVPAVTAATALLVMRRRRRLGAAISLVGSLVALAVAVALLVRAGGDAIGTYAIGGWRAPFGIVLVLDRLSATMLVLASLLGAIVLLHAVVTAADRRGWHFHPLFQFQMLGLNGAFLTGDLFNLFVFFEVLLIASYGLMLHGQGAARLKAGVGYVVVNIVGSAVFLVALGLLYGLAGTLNMADLGRRIAALPPGDGGLARTAGLLLTAVFALKAAVAPLHLWLPRTYAATMPVVAALFAIMTKVGVYAIIRVVPLVFGAAAGQAAWVPSPWLAPAAVATALLGFGGVLAARGLRESAAYAVLGSTGSLLLVLAAWTPAATGAALFYLLNATFAGAALFLVADVAMRRRGHYADAIVPTPRFAGQDGVAILYLAACIAAVGLPPLAGFVGKLMMLRAVADAPGTAAIWAVILGTTLIGVVGFARSGSAVFWKPAGDGAAPLDAARPVRGDVVAPTAALVAIVLLTILAGPVSAWTGATAAQLFAPDRYVAAVLRPEAGR